MRLAIVRDFVAIRVCVTGLRLALAALGDTLMELPDVGGVVRPREGGETPDASNAGPDPSNSFGTLPLFEDYSEQPDSGEHAPIGAHHGTTTC